MSHDDNAANAGHHTETAAAKSASSSPCGCGGSCGGACPSCAAETADIKPAPVYALGRIRPHIPNLGLEKELTQTVGRVFNNGPSDEDALCALLVMEEHRRLAYEMCWTFVIDDTDVYSLRPADAFGLSLILGALRPDKSHADIDVVIGRMIGRTGFTECNGKLLATVVPSQIYSLDRSTLLSTLPAAAGVGSDAMKSAVKQTLDVMSQLGGNYGLSPSHRALNYAVTRSAELYQTVAANLLENWTLASLSSKPSTMAAGRNVIDVILIFRSRLNDALRKSFMRIDVTDLYPFLVTPIRPFLEFN